AATRIEQSRRTWSQSNAIGRERNGPDSTGGNIDVRIVTGVRTLRIVQSVLHSHRIVVPASCREGRRAALALADLMKMDAVSSGRQRDGGHVDVDQAVLVLPDIAGADGRSSDVVHHHLCPGDRVSDSLKRRARAD